MLRKLACAAVVLLLGVGMIIADEVKGKIKKIDRSDKEKGAVVTVTVDGKDMDFTLGKGAKGVKYHDGDKEVDRKDKEAFGAFMKDRFKEGNEVTVVYTKDGEKKTVTDIKIKK